MPLSERDYMRTHSRPSRDARPVIYTRRGSRFGGLLRSVLMLLGVVLIALAITLVLNPAPTLSTLQESAAQIRAKLHITSGTDATASSSGKIVPPAYRGVQACAYADFDFGNDVCQHNRSRIALGQVHMARLTVSGKDGAYFTDPVLDFIVSKDFESGQTEIQGHMNQDVELTMNILSVRLRDVLAAAHVTPKAGTTYHIEVDDGSTLLGDKTLTFTR